MATVTPKSMLATSQEAPDASASRREQLFSGGFGVLLATAVFLPLQEKLEYDYFAFYGSDILLLLGVIALLFARRTGRSDTAVRCMSLAVGGLALFSLMSVFTAEFYTGFADTYARLTLWRRIGGTLIVYVFASRLLLNRRQVLALLHGITFVLLIASVQLLRETYAIGISASHFKDSLRSTGLFPGNGINDMGAFFAELCFVPLCLFALERGALKRTYLLCVAGLSMCACMFTFSRGAWLAMGAGFLFYAFRRGKKAVAILLLGALVAAPFLPSSVVDRFSMTTTEGGQLEESAGSRVVLWNAAIDMIKANPVLGVGLERFKELVSLHLQPHNMYLKIATEQGLPALFCFIFFLGATLAAIWRPIDDFERHVFVAMTGSWAAFVVVNMFGNRFTREGLMADYLILLGVVAFLRRSRPQQTEAP